jgi:hypothetical protein
MFHAGLRPEMMPSVEDEILVACSRLQFDLAHRDRVNLACARAPVNWELVYSAAVAHKVAPLVYRNLEGCGSVSDLLPQKVRDDFQSVSRWQALKNAIVTEGIADLAAFFESRSHDVLLLKHAAFATRLRALYDVTMSDDVDVVVRPRGEAPERIDERYRFRIRPWMLEDKLQRRFRRFIHDDTDQTSGVIREFAALNRPWQSICGLELDNRIHHDVIWGGVIAIDFRMVWRDANRDQLEGRPVHVPAPCDLIIMSAGSTHRKPYLMLRNLVEIHELGLTLRDCDWEMLASKARAFECGRLVYSALHATRAILDCGIPESSLNALMPSALRRRVVAFVNARISPSAICRPRSPGARPRTPRRGLRESARRFLGLDARQIMRFVWLRIVLYRILGVIKW